MGDRAPNVLFFFADDQRFDTIRALGNADIETPTLDGLVERGTAFTRAHIMGGSCPAVCMPSRAMMMTGRTLFRIQDLGQEIPEEHVTMPEWFRQHGYETFGTGKWHNGERAFARSFTDGGSIFFGGMEDHWNVPVADFDPAGLYPVEARRRVRNRHSSELFCDEALAFLGRRDSRRPFFAYVSFMAPHDPRTMPKAYLDRYEPAGLPLPESFMPRHPFDNGELEIRDERLAAWPRTEGEIRWHMADYYGMITHLDAQVGRVLERLRAQGLERDTIVLFAGDNGLAIGRHGLMGKQSLYDHSVRVPLLFRGPGVPAGARREALCGLHDLFPTLCGLAGLPVPGSVEGKSLVPCLGAARATVREEMLLAYKDVQRGVTDGAFKLIEYVVGGARRTQLFDLRADPAEVRDLAADPAYAGQVARLRAKVIDWRDALGDKGELGCRFWRGFESGAAGDTESPARSEAGAAKGAPAV